MAICCTNVVSKGFRDTLLKFLYSIHTTHIKELIVFYTHILIVIWNTFKIKIKISNGFVLLVFVLKSLCIWLLTK